MSHFSAEVKHTILLEYTPRDTTHSLAALARRHNIKGGVRTLKNWKRRWDGTAASLEEKQHTGRPRILSALEVSRHIRAPILAANRAHRAVNYAQLLPEVKRKTGKNISVRSLRRYGKAELNVKSKTTQKRTATELSAAHCEQIAQMRRKLQKIPKSHILFLDETHLRLSAAPNRTLTLPGEQPLVIATDTSSYAARYDMIAVCSGERVLLPKIYSPAERRGAAVKGINAAMLHRFIDDTLAQAVEGLDLYPLTLVIDRATIHQNTDAILQSFQDRGSESIKQILLMPANSAKRLSPLDNSLFHDWKELCRKSCPVTNRTIERVMADAWNKLSPRLLRAHYRQCGLLRDQDPYFDCPDPVAHAHTH